LARHWHSLWVVSIDVGQKVLQQFSNAQKPLRPLPGAILFDVQ
jgi:hypothetical protein